jgi:hypothetical protein
MIVKASADTYQYTVVTRFDVDNIEVGPSKQIRRYQPFYLNEIIEVLVSSVTAALNRNKIIQSADKYVDDDLETEYLDEYVDDANEEEAFDDDDEVDKRGPFATATVVRIVSHTKVSVLVNGIDDIVDVYIPDIRRGCNVTRSNTQTVTSTSILQFAGYS